MRRERMLFKLGILLFVILAGGFFFLLVPVSEVVTVGVAAPVEVIAGGLEAFFPWVIVTVVVLIVAVALVVIGQSRSSSGQRQRKRKHEEDAAYLDEMIEQGVVRLEDDGELPDLAEDDLYTGDKPKRTEDEDFR